MEIRDSYERITFFVCYFLYRNKILYEDNKIFTIKSYSEDTGIPLRNVRNDVAVLFCNAPYLGITIDNKFYEDFENDKPDCKNHIMDDIRSGKYDSASIDITDWVTFLNREDSVFIPHSLEEKLVLTNYLLPNKSPYHVKKIFNPDPSTIKELVRDIIEKTTPINDAIKESRSVSFSYHYNSTVTTISCIPVKILFDSEDVYDTALLAADGKKYYLNSIRQIVLGEVDKSHILTAETLPEDKKELFKIKVFATTRNIKEKIKSDILRGGGKIEEIPDEDNCFICEGNIFSFNNFKRWIQGYGSSVKIIEPLSYADEIKDENERILRQYSSGQFE